MLWAPDKVRISISKIPIFPSISIVDHLLESSQRDDSNKWSNIEFGEEIRQVESIEVHLTHLIWSSGSCLKHPLICPLDSLDPKQGLMFCEGLICVYVIWE